MENRRLHFIFCHQNPERSFFWKKKQFPVCARCTGIHLGYFTFPVFLFDLYSINIWFTIAIILPTYIDGITQAYFKRESNNILRVSTGLMAGVGKMSLVAIIGQFIGKQILTLIN